MKAADWFGFPHLHGPDFKTSAILVALPAVIALIAENTGHVKAVAAMTETDLDPYLGRAIAADGVGTVLASAVGGSPTTTYAENIGVMAATRIYSTAAYYVAAIVAILFGLCPKFGALVAATPGGVLGGITVVLYGMIGLLGAKIWIENRVDFGDPVNLVPVAAGIILAIGNVTLKITKDFPLQGIALGTIARARRLPRRWPPRSGPRATTAAGSSRPASATRSRTRRPSSAAARRRRGGVSRLVKPPPFDAPRAGDPGGGSRRPRAYGGGRQGPGRRPEPDPAAEHAAGRPGAPGRHQPRHRAGHPGGHAGRAYASARWPGTRGWSAPTRPRGCSRCCARRCGRSPTPSYATAARSWAASRTPTRRPSCPPVLALLEGTVEAVSAGRAAA